MYIVSDDRVMRTLAAVMMMYLMASMTTAAGQTFKPWDATVAVGDERVDAVIEGAPAGGAGADRGVYDAFRGGAILLIRLFQIWISPLDGPNCRYRPTCSAYGKIAVQKYGAVLGGVLAGDRILRCNPFSKPGDDPVPILR
jgi:putative membrane protein insertion efficiency factor